MEKTCSVHSKAVTESTPQESTGNEKTKEKTWGEPYVLWDSVKQPKLCVIGLLEIKGKEREKYSDGSGHYQSLEGLWTISEGLLVTKTHAGLGPELECLVCMTLLSLAGPGTREKISRKMLQSTGILEWQDTGQGPHWPPVYWRDCIHILFIPGKIAVGPLSRYAQLHLCCWWNEM